MDLFNYFRKTGYPQKRAEPGESGALKRGLRNFEAGKITKYENKTQTGIITNELKSA